ncbi:MAG: shikimate kinase, partial [Phaeodactylibacter sp.]|nr:shikimate kinase [Phaeodactylibacter sp.]
MGSGKSAVGKQLSQALSLPFQDLDTYLEAAVGRSISQIFEEAGEAVFRQMEQFYLRRVLQEYPDLILATGGGTPCFFDNMVQMRQASTCIYLQTPVDQLVQRLWQETEHRPLLNGKSPLQVRQFLEDQ